MDGNLSQQLTDLPIVGMSAHPFAVLLALQVVDALLTLGHSLQELRGRLWDYFGAIVGVRVPRRVGLVGFFGVLTIGLWIDAAVAIWGGGLLPNRGTVFAVGLLIGSRVSDGIFSHLLLHLRQYRPNPGLTSVPLHFGEALLLAAVFHPRLVAFPLSATAGFVSSIVVFSAILPLLGRYGPRIWPPRDRWRPGEPRPT